MINDRTHGLRGAVGNAGGGAASMSRGQAEAVLARRQDELDRITSALLELDDHRGRKLLAGADLTGETKRRWDSARARLDTLWRTFDAYKRVLTRAREVAERHGKLDDNDLVELTLLLTGPSIELGVEAPPLAERTLLGPTSERITLDDALDRMNQAYSEAADVVGAADTAFSALLTRLGGADEALRGVRQVLAELSADDRGADRAAAELDDLRRAVLADPLSFAHGGRFDTSRIDALSAELGDLRAELDSAVRLRGEYAERLRAIEEAIGAVASAEERARAARGLALVKILDPAVDDPPDTTGGLRERLAAVSGAGATVPWRDRSGHVESIERAVAAADAGARAAEESATSLIDRRDELRGRLQAYQAKAARYGLAEDEKLSAAGRLARELLWTAPCDLRAATRAVAGYLHAFEALQVRPGVDG
jgi:hypothetical protein